MKIATGRNQNFSATKEAMEMREYMFIDRQVGTILGAWVLEMLGRGELVLSPKYTEIVKIWTPGVDGRM